MLNAVAYSILPSCAVASNKLQLVGKSLSGPFIHRGNIKIRENSVFFDRINKMPLLLMRTQTITPHCGAGGR